MSNITNENYYQLFHSVDGEIEDDTDLFSDSLASPPAQQSDFDSTDMDVDMGCGLETIEQLNFSGIGPGGIVAEKITGPLPPVSHTPQASTTVSNSMTEVEWDSMIAEPYNLATQQSHQALPRTLELPVRNTSVFESFPSPTIAELQQGTDAPLDRPDPDSETFDARSSTVNSDSSDSDMVEGYSDYEMSVDDDTALAAAMDTTSLEPPFWDSSSDCSEDEDDTTFANDGWADPSDLQPRQDWTPELQLMQELHGNIYDERTRQWVRRGAVSGPPGGNGP